MNSGDRIRAARKERKFTQKHLGELCGIAEPTIRRYELGKLNPKYETLQRIAAALNVKTWELLGDEEEELEEISSHIYDIESLKKVLKSAGLLLDNVCIEDDETDPKDYLYYVWHENRDQMKDSVTHSFGELLRLVNTIAEDAEAHKRDYFRKRLDAELFFGHIKTFQKPAEPPPPASGGTDTAPSSDAPETPPEGE